MLHYKISKEVKSSVHLVAAENWKIKKLINIKLRWKKRQNQLAHQSWILKLHFSKKQIYRSKKMQKIYQTSINQT